MQNIFKLCPLLIIYFIIVNPAQTFSSADSELPFTLEERNRWGPCFFSPVDIERDGVDEFLYIQKEKQYPYSMRCYSQLGLPQFQKNFIQGVIYHPPLAYWNAEGRLNILVSSTVDDVAFLHIIEIVNKKPIETGTYEIAKGVDRRGDGGWDGHVAPVAVADLNNDGFMEVLLIIYSQKDLHPRGVCAFSPLENRKLWEFPTGTYLNSRLIVTDLTNDGLPEIVIGSGAMSNGSVANSTDDEHSYLLILNHNGEALNIKKMGGTFSSCSAHMADLNGDEKQELITLLDSSNKSKGKPGRITVWNGMASSKKWEIANNPLYYKLASADLNHDGKQELVLISSINKKLCILRDSLKTIAEKSIDFKPTKILTEDLNADGKLEIVISGDGQTDVLDEKYKTIAHIPRSGPLTTLRQGFNKPKLLAIGGAGGHIYFYELKRNAIFLVRRLVWLGVGIAVVAFLVFAFSNIAPRKFYSSSLRVLLEKMPYAIILVDRKGKLLIHNQKANAFLDLQNISKKRDNLLNAFVKELHESLNALISPLMQSKSEVDLSDSIELALSNGRQIFISAHTITKNRVFPNGILICIQDISLQSESKRALEWAAMSQRLAHEIKNPLSVIKLTLQRLKMLFADHNPPHGDVYSKHVDSVLEEVDRLKSATDGFMKLTRAEPPHFKIHSVEEVVNAVKDKYSDKLPDGVKFEIELEKNLPVVEIDFEQILVVFSNLIDNSVRAMAGKGLLHWHISLFQKISVKDAGTPTNVIVFELSDTGCGIPEDRLERVFEPYFSEGSQGTGLGLAIAKRIVEDHEGEISIVSKVDAGTTVRVELPVTA